VTVRVRGFAGGRRDVRLAFLPEDRLRQPKPLDQDSGGAECRHEPAERCAEQGEQHRMPGFQGSKSAGIAALSDARAAAQLGERRLVDDALLRRCRRES
jgi:hypothetical protein